MIDRSTAPDFKTFSDFDLQKPEKYQLNNNIKLYGFKNTSQPILGVQLIFKAGKWYEKNSGAASLLSAWLPTGTKKLNSNEIDEYFEYHGAFKSFSADNDFFSIEFYCPKRHFTKIISLIHEILTEPSFSQIEFGLLQKIWVEKLKINLEKTSNEARVLFKKNLFGEDHPYGKSLMPSIVENFNSISAEEHYNSFIKNKPFDVLLIGDYDQETVNEINSEFGSIHIEANGSRPFIPNLDKETGLFYKERENALQTSIRSGNTLFNIESEDKIPFEVTNTIFGGYFGSRLMKNIREDKGYTYGINSTISFSQNAGFFCISTDVIKEKRENTLSEINKEIDLLCEELVSSKELERVKNYLAGSYIRSIQSPFALAQYFKTIHYFDLPENYFDTYISKIQSVTPSQVQEMANKHLKEGRVTVMVG